MGNHQSTQSKEETRRSNRLSKPLTKKLALSSPQLSREEYETASGLVRWENTWVSNLPEVKNFASAETREISTTSFESKSTTPKKHSLKQANASVSTMDHLSASSGSSVTSRAAKRASQPVISPISTQSSSASPHPRRANSVQLNLQRHGSVIYESPVEDVASSNTHFLVDNQRFSLTRRRSLLTRPGVATRRTTGAIRRVPSPIGEPEMDDSESALLAWSLPPRRRSARQSRVSERPTSPADAQYTQLGALKLGSLRVVNGSASPCPSERTPLDRSIIVAGLGLQSVETMCPKPTVEIPVTSDLKKSDDFPASPFSFEKSPIISVPSRSKTLHIKEIEDEGIAMCDDSQLEKNITMETVLDRSTSGSLNKSDSGYSSATSLHSIQRSRTSVDSQSSVSNIAADKIQRHLNLQEKPGNYSRPQPNSARWYDGNGPHPPARSAVGARRSTLCAPRYTEYPVQTGLASEYVKSTYPLIFQEEQTISSRGPLYADRFSMTPLDSSYNSSPSTSLERATSHRKSTDKSIKPRVHRSASEHHLNRKNLEEAEMFQSRSRSRASSGRVWRQRPGIEVPPLPTILSPGHILAGEEEEDAGFHGTEHRGRPRTRSQDYRRRKLNKLRPQPTVHMTTSTVSLR
ncbi:hypothetical protein N7478_013394 [Penicillium angulare]|uniref:uncharacterized protein n=1 Tax=Penicillium angulare TaxID=116970 RepID=UPI002541E21E|nr:uncharacterized protein N7478_013394 [Penicillium angulare]KAJ5257290.1 hypothetical protein N7478_013394 [Penicillium angulare]